MIQTLLVKPQASSKFRARHPRTFFEFSDRGEANLSGGGSAVNLGGPLKRDEIWLNRHRALAP
jgi:hypothetical protein